MGSDVAIRWENEELDRSRRRGVWDRWGVEDAERREEWLLFGMLNKRRIYAPLEHPELPHQFAAAARSEAALLTFVRAYGRLGWAELSSHDVGRSSWLQRTMRVWESVIEREGERAFNAEPIEWITAHAETVAWCLQAG